MSSIKDEHLIGENTGDDTEKLKASDEIDGSDKNPMPSSEEQEETIKKKYGGLVPKKPPLISKDHERAFFDSADWALGKGKPKGPVEALRPKLQPTPHQQVRRSAYAPSEDGEVEGGHNDTTTEDQSTSHTGGVDENNSNAVA